jgi:hypothetical protein
VAQLLSQSTAAAGKKDWRRTLGLFANDPVMWEIDAVGASHPRSGSPAGPVVILLDTDHRNVLKYPDSMQFVTLTTRLNASADQDIATTVITVGEIIGGVVTVGLSALGGAVSVAASGCAGNPESRPRSRSTGVAVIPSVVLHKSVLARVRERLASDPPRGSKCFIAPLMHPVNHSVENCMALISAQNGGDHGKTHQD